MPNQPGFADVACPPWPLLLMSRWPLLARLLARLLAAGLHVCCNTACTFAGRWPLLACEASLPLTISPHALLLPAILLAADARCSQARPRERELLHALHAGHSTCCAAHVSLHHLASGALAFSPWPHREQSCHSFIPNRRARAS